VAGSLRAWLARPRVRDLQTVRAKLYNGSPSRNARFQEIALSFVRLIAALLLAILLSGCQTGPPVVRTPDGFDPPYNYY